jgi:hypothetical protein
VRALHGHQAVGCQGRGGGQGDVVDRRIITEPDSELSVQYTMKVSAGGSVAGEVAILCGVAKLQNSIVRLVSA